MAGRVEESRDPAYRWVILGAVSVLLAIVMGQILNAFSIFFIPLEAEYGWGRAGIAAVNTAGLIGIAFGSILMGFAAERFGARRVATFGITVFGLATIIASQATALWQFYGLYFVAGLLGAGAISAPLMALLGSWFRVGAGLAIGIAAASQAAGQGGVPFAGALLVEALGWRGSLFGLGVATLVVGLPLALLLRPPPYAADGSAAADETPSGLPNGLITGWLAIAVVFCCTTMSVPLMHLVPLVQGRGFSASDAGSVIFLMLTVAIAGRVAFGQLADKIGPIPSYFIASAWQTSFVFGFALIASLPLFYLYAAVYGFGYAGVMTSILVSVRYLCAPARRASSTGIVLAFAYVGHGLGGWQGGYFFDLTGAYTWTYANAALSGMVNLVIVGGLWWVLTHRPARTRTA